MTDQLTIMKKWSKSTWWNFIHTGWNDQCDKTHNAWAGKEHQQSTGGGGGSRNWGEGKAKNGQGKAQMSCGSA